MPCVGTKVHACLYTFQQSLSVTKLARTQRNVAEPCFFSEFSHSKVPRHGLSTVVMEAGPDWLSVRACVRACVRAILNIPESCVFPLWFSDFAKNTQTMSYLVGYYFHLLTSLSGQGNCDIVYTGSVFALKMYFIIPPNLNAGTLLDNPPLFLPKTPERLNG